MLFLLRPDFPNVFITDEAGRDVYWVRSGVADQVGLWSLRDLGGTELVRPDTEVTVLVPKRGFAKFWHRVLHDRSSTGLFKVLGNIDGVNVVIVPFRLGRRPILRSVPTDGYPTAPRA